MALPSIQDLEFIRKTVRPPEVAELRSALSRIALEVNARLQGGAGTSTPFMISVVDVLKGLEGDAFAELRINCLIDVAHYFYVIGQPFSAIEPSRGAVELAERSNHPALHRKALSILGVVFADTGNVSHAIECYAKALDLAQ